jgi:predicted RNA methylase
MCGVGTYLFAASFVAKCLGVRASARGCDVSNESIDMARHNSESHATDMHLSVCDCLEQSPCTDGWAHLVMVDPPWLANFGTLDMYMHELILKLIFTYTELW